eukprot:PhF_6_TR8639/c0_g1_i2/m.13498
MSRSNNAFTRCILTIGLILFVVLYVNFFGNEGVHSPSHPCRVKRTRYTANQKPQPVVCSKGYHPLYYKNIPQALARLVASGVVCFDLDIFASSDGVVYVGNPDEVQKVLKLNDPPSSYPSQAIRPSSGSTYPSTLTELLDSFTPSMLRHMHFITLEPFGALRSQSIEAHVLMMTSHDTLRMYPTHFRWIVDDPTKAAEIRKRLPSTRVALPLT